MNKEFFKHFWQENYNDLPPIGFVLRDHFFNDRWFRIHSLPNSKRYAEDQNEMRLILDRQNSLITDLIGENNDYVLLLMSFSDGPTSECFSESDGDIVLESLRLDKVLPQRYGYESYLHLSIINKSWKIGSIDDYLEAVANEKPIINKDPWGVYSFLIIDTKYNRIIAPYDGGVDIFLNTMKERDVFKLKYKDWLSSTESGL